MFITILIASNKFSLSSVYFLSAVIISLGAKKYNASKGTVILIGVALNSLLNALADGVNVFFKDAAVLSHEFKVGDFSGVTLKATIYPAIFILIAIVLLVSLSKELEILSMGEDCAKSLGVNTKTMRVTFLMLSLAFSLFDVTCWR